TDGGAFGELGADHFIRRSPLRRRIVAAINLDSVAGHGAPRLELAGDEARSPSAKLVETAAVRVAEQTGRGVPGRTSAVGQLIDLAFPFSLYEQAALIAAGVPAVTLTTAGDRPPNSFSDRPGGL